MKRLLLAVTLALAVVACGLGAPASAATVESAAGERQIMVMLRLPPPHFNAGSSYGGGYGDGQGRAARRRLASAVARKFGLTMVSDWPMPLAGVECYVMAVPQGRSTADLVQRIAQERAVAWAEPVETFSAQATPREPNDPLYAMQPATWAWRLSALHELATGRNVRVAVIDSLIDVAHPDLIGQIALSEDFRPAAAAGPETHGTGVAGVIAARADNDKGIVGVAPAARLLALRACGESRAPEGGVQTTCDSLSLAKALIFAIDRRAEVINLSLSGPATPLLVRLVDTALARGAVVVAAYDEKRPDGGFPASHTGVIAVGSESTVAGKSVYLALGRDVLTTQPGGGWGLANGSSYAAAHVSGLFALVRERGHEARPGLALVSPQSRAVDPCATLLRHAGPCACGCARQTEAFAGRP